MSGIGHLYVHVLPGVPDEARAVGALARELELRQASDRLGRPLKTMGVGGSAASSFGPRFMTALRNAVGDPHLEGVSEWTAEGSPAHLDEALLYEWREAGTTRISVDLGSLRGDALDRMGRGHGPETARAALRDVAAAGFATWGIDLLYGLPPEADPDPVESVVEAVELGVPHVSLYEWEGPGGADDDLRADQYLAMAESLRKAGLEAYEMMAFARPGHESRHARAMLRGASCLGIGPGAHSRVGDRRSWNLSEWPVYLSTVESGRVPGDGEERPDAGERRLEELWSGLRLREGVSRSGLRSESRRLGARWVRLGLAHADEERVRLTPEGWLRLDELAVELARTEASITRPPPGRGRSED